MTKLPGQKSIEIRTDRTGRFFAMNTEARINFPITIDGRTYWPNRSMLAHLLKSMGFYILELDT